MIIVWKTIIWFSMLLFSIACFAQQTFSTRSYGIMNTVYNSVQVLDDGYLTCGWTFDTVPLIHKDILLTKFDLEGTNQWEQNYGDPQFETFTQENTNSVIEGIYLQQGVSENEEEIMLARLIWYNEMGDTLKTKDYYSPYFIEEGGDDFINPLFSFLLPDSTIYLSAVIFEDNGTANDVCIWHLDKDGNELWHYIYATEADPEQCYSMIPWGGGVLAEINKGNDSNPFLNELVLIILNSEGQLEAEIPESLWNNYSYALTNLLIESDGVICNGSVCEEDGLTSQAAIWKIDPDGSLIWSQPVGGYANENNVYRAFQTLTKSTDGNYVSTGDFFIAGEENSYHFNVWVTKNDSSNGQLMWQRFYSIVESENDIHGAIDLKATPDGGVVFCGHASDAWSQNPNLELPAQQGWIVKLDACGCLVPGCDENCTVSITENESLENQSLFLVGPNPAQDFLNIYLKEISGVQYVDIVFEIFDLSGKLVKSFSPYKGDTTYLLDTTALESGEYVLLLKNGDKILQREKILVVR
ncbi:MAG: T9SS type A sorting domain-containing protein [Flavobacteriales bacterium]